MPCRFGIYKYAPAMLGLDSKCTRCVCVRARTHARARTGEHAYILIYIHTYIHTYVYTYMHTYIHTYRHTYIHSKLMSCVNNNFQ